MKKTVMRKVLDIIIIVLFAGLIGLGIWQFAEENARKEALKKSIFFDNGNSVVMSADEIPAGCGSIILAAADENVFYRRTLSYGDAVVKTCCVVVNEDMMNEDTLRKVAATGAEAVTYRCGYFGMEPLAEMNTLRSLNVQCELPGDLGSIVKMTSLRELYLRNVTTLSDTSGIKSLNGLEKLDLTGTAVTDISELAYLSKLRELNITSTGISDISALWSANELEVFDAYNAKVEDISTLADKPKLRDIDLYGCPVSSIDALEGDTALEKAELSYTKIKDISPLMKCPKLYYASYFDCDVQWRLDEDFKEWFTSRGMTVWLHGIKIEQN